jgi:predicted phage terminase large subunit-like protein
MSVDLLIMIARKDFRAFLQLCFTILNPYETFEESWHIDAVLQVLFSLQAGRSRRWVVNLPPRTLKSTIISVAWVAFLLGLNPGLKILVVSYNEDLAERFSLMTRRIMQHKFYRRLFPGTRLERATNMLLETDCGGLREAISIGGTTTGLGADWIIIDDPHNASEIISPTARDRVKRYYGQSLLSRFNHRPSGRLILVMQRLHEDDLAGHLLSQGGWNCLSLPAQATDDRLVDIGNAQPHHFRKGDLLLPGWLPQVELDDLRQQMGSRDYEAQVQQNPTPHEGNIIKAHWVSYADLPSRDDTEVTLSLDTATKTGHANDYSAATIWLRKGKYHHVIHAWRDKVDFPDLIHAVRRMHRDFSPSHILIEDQGSGTSLRQALNNLGIPTIPFRSPDSKETRLWSVTDLFEDGLVHFLKDAPWLGMLEGELLGFPNTKNNDLVDSVTQYLIWARPRGHSPPFTWDIGPDDGPNHDSIAQAWLWSKGGW